MQLQIENERTFLTYKYKKVQDIDDVILQLLNEADIEGFVESHMNKAKSTVNYDVTGYRKWSEISSDELTPEVMASAMENLYHLLAYLEDSFIDIEYVLLDKEYIYVNPGNGKLVILVVPCQAVVDEEYTLTDCVRQMFEQFTYGEGECYHHQLPGCCGGFSGSWLRSVVRKERTCGNSICGQADPGGGKALGRALHQ